MPYKDKEKQREAQREWEIVGCEVDETHSATCVCGKEGLRYVYTIANTETGETLSPIGSSCLPVGSKPSN